MSNETIARTSAGVPTGGQFTKKTHADGDICLVNGAGQEVEQYSQYDGPAIAGYTFQGVNHSAQQLTALLTGNPNATDDPDYIETLLDEMAEEDGIDRTDEYTFDSDKSPKTILPEQLNCSDLSWNENAPEHLVVYGTEFPECSRCGFEAMALSTMDA